jgi:hypothetical protein
MLPAVQLDREARGPAGEVGDVAVDLELADELLAFKATTAEVVPEALFGFGPAGSEPAGDWGQALSSQLRAPSPNPLPAGERALERRLPLTPSPRGGEGRGEGARRFSSHLRISNNLSERVN